MSGRSGRVIITVPQADRSTARRHPVTPHDEVVHQ